MSSSNFRENTPEFRSITDLEITPNNAGFTKARLRLPYALSFGPQARNSLQAGGFFGAPLRALGAAGNSFAGALIFAALFIALASAVVVVYQCGSWASYSRSSAHKLFLQQQAQQHTYLPYAGFQAHSAKSSTRSSPPECGANSLMPQLVRGQANKQLAANCADYQQQLDLLQANSAACAQANAAKEYETQMLKMSVLFDDNNSLDEQNLHQNQVSKQLN